MEKFDTSKVDVHSLRVILKTYEHGSLTGAARALNLSQSSLSYTLARMREALSDPLFVQQGRGIVPTARCIALIPRIEEVLATFEALFRVPVFDPATSDRVIRLCCNYYERSVLLPPLLEAVRAQGPDLRVEVSTADTDGHEALLDGRADVLLSPLVADQSGLMVRRLFDDRYVCLLHRDDPRRHGLDLETYAAADHVVVDYERGWTPFYLEALHELGVRISPVLSLPSFGALRGILETGRYIVTLPARAAPAFGPQFVPVDAPFEAGFTLKLFWRERDQGDGFSRWLRGLIIDIAENLSTPERS